MNRKLHLSDTFLILMDSVKKQQFEEKKKFKNDNGDTLKYIKMKNDTQKYFRNNLNYTS